MATPTPSSLKRRAKRWNEKLISCLWLPFSLLFDLWVYLTPTYEERWGAFQPRPSRSRGRLLSMNLAPLPGIVFAVALGIMLLAMVALPAAESRVLLVLGFGVCLWQFMRPRS